ncbi:MAG: Holliday junction resolvase RuvX [Thermodesulfobacteriota bacterium]
MRILGLDIGTKRIGVAVSDPLGITAQSVAVVECKGSEKDLERIASLVKEYKVTEIVVGVPYNMDGSEGPQAQKVRRFMAEITARVGLPVREWDERLSTVAAERVLLEADMSRAKRRKVIDKVAAVIILQGYLDKKRGGLAIS